MQREPVQPGGPMTRFARELMVLLCLGGPLARAGALEDWERASGPGTIVESSVRIDPPWGPPTVLNLSGNEAGCTNQLAGQLDFDLDLDLIGLPLDFLRLERSEVELPPDEMRFVNPELREACVNYLGREITVVRVYGDLYGRFDALPAPVAPRCGGLDQVTGYTVGPHPDGTPSSFRIDFHDGCGPSMSPTRQVIPITVNRLRILGGTDRPLTEPRVIALEVPGSVCNFQPEPEAVPFFRATVRADVAPSPGRMFPVVVGAPAIDRPGITELDASLSPGNRHRTIRVPLDRDFEGTLNLYARAADNSSRVAASVQVHLPEVGVCPITFLDVARFEPRFDGCWTCNYRLDRSHLARVLNARLQAGQVRRMKNGVAARNVLGVVASVSETPKGLPVSVLTLEGQVLQTFVGVELTDLNDVGDAVGARVNPDSGGRRAVWIDGAEVKELGTLGGNSSDVLALSESGWFVGWADDKDGRRRAFVSEGSDLKAIALPEHVESEATGIGGDRWVIGTLVDLQGTRRGFMKDVRTGQVHLTELPQGITEARLVQVDAWGRAVGTLHVEGKPDGIPVLFSAEGGLVPLAQFAVLPKGFVTHAALGLTDDGALFLGGLRDGKPAFYVFTP